MVDATRMRITLPSALAPGKQVELQFAWGFDVPSTPGLVAPEMIDAAHRGELAEPEDVGVHVGLARLALVVREHDPVGDVVADHGVEAPSEVGDHRVLACQLVG